MSGKTIDRQCQHTDVHQCDGQAAEGFRDGLAAQAVAGFRQVLEAMMDRDMRAQFQALRDVAAEGAALRVRG